MFFSVPSWKIAFVLNAICRSTLAFRNAVADVPARRRFYRPKNVFYVPRFCEVRPNLCYRIFRRRCFGVRFRQKSRDIVPVAVVELCSQLELNSHDGGDGSGGEHEKSSPKLTNAIWWKEAFLRRERDVTAPSAGTTGAV